MEAGIASTLLFVYPIFSGADHGVCLQGEINVTNHLLYLAGIRAVSAYFIKVATERLLV